MLKTTTFIKTKSFNLAVYQKGDIKSDKLALVLPGKLDTKDYPHMREHVDFLSSIGYLALSFDPPGTWESEGDISMFTATNYIKAIKELIEYFKNKPTFLLGHSMGANMSIIAGTKLKQVKGFISIMGTACYKKKSPQWKENGTQLSIRDTPLEYTQKTKSFNMPYSYLEDFYKYDTTEDLKKCTKPKLFIICDKDDENRKKIVKETYNLSSYPKKLIIINAEHDYRKNKNSIIEINKAIENLLISKNNHK